MGKLKCRVGVVGLTDEQQLPSTVPLDKSAAALRANISTTSRRNKTILGQERSVEHV